MIISNIYNGIIWFLLPVSCVVINDISAYFWGRMLGKHSLSPLSPKKTWEGFIGGFFSTIIFGFILTNILSNFEALLCPVIEIGITQFKQFTMTCDNSELNKILYDFSFKNPLNGKIIPFMIRNIHFHTFAIGLFAGILAPLGGLFASGFKRAINIKDFADTIPGHGGLTDRMDCQLLMGVFTYVWLSQFYFFDEKKVLNSLVKQIEGMKSEDRLRVYKYIGKSLGLI
jgi:phosphatidate cytidylyltransferase